MSRENLVINGIFYFILTAFFIYIFVREKYLVEKIAKYRDRFSEKIITIFGIKGEGTQKAVHKIVNGSEAVITAVILVLIVINGIFYFILTAFFIYIFVREKYLVEKIAKYRDRFSEKIITIFGIKGEGTQKAVHKIVNGSEAIITAVILVLIIQRFYIGNFMVPTGSMEKTIMPKDRLFGNMVVYKFKAPKREDIVVFKEPVENKVLYTKRVMGLPGEKINIRNGHLFADGREIDSREYSALGMIGFDTWVVPKKDDVIIIKPGMNYNEEYQRVNFDIGKVQKLLMENGNTDIIEQFLPKLKFYVNGEETGMILDYLHDENILKKITSGETVEIVLDEDCYFMLGDNTNGSYDSRFWGFVKDSRIRGKAVVRFWPLNRISLLK